MATYIFEDATGNELNRMTDEDNAELRTLGLGDRIGDGHGGKIRILQISYDVVGDETIVRFQVVPWTLD
jgi:hypothetical protein